jgi:hypothetical protein
MAGSISDLASAATVAALSFDIKVIGPSGFLNSIGHKGLREVLSHHLLSGALKIYKSKISESFSFPRAYFEHVERGTGSTIGKLYL